MGQSLDEKVHFDQRGHATIHLPAFAGWGTVWLCSGGPDDRPEAAKAGLFPIALESNSPGPVPQAQVRALETLVSAQTVIAERVAIALVNFLRLFEDAPEDMVPLDAAVARSAVVLSGIRVYDPQVDSRYERGGVGLIGLGFSSDWSGHTSDHGIEAVVCGDEVLHVGDQGTF